MKLIYLHQYYRTNASDGGTRSYEFSKYLSDKGMDVQVITGTALSPDYRETDRLSVYSTNTEYNNKMSKLKRIIAFFDYIIKAFIMGMKTKDVDMIFATSTPLTIGLPAVLLSKAKRKKLIFEVRDVWPDIPYELGYIKSKWLMYALRKYELWIYKHSSHIIVLSEGMHNNLLAKGVNPNKMTVIENMSNLYLYEYDTLQEAFKYSYSSEKFVCIHPGTMGHVNGLDYILDVAKHTLTQDPNIIFLLIGEGNRKNYLINRVKEEKLENVVITNSLSKTEIVQVIKSSDIGIMCVDNRYKILEDNSANKFFDYLAAGLPVLINYEGWQKDVIERENCGESHLEASQMANSIIQLKNDKELRTQMGENARKLAEAKYSDVKAKQKLLHLIHNI